MASIKQILFGGNIIAYIFVLIGSVISIASVPIVGLFLFTILNLPWLIINWLLIHKFYKDKTEIYKAINELIIEKQAEAVLGEIKI